MSEPSDNTFALVVTRSVLEAGQFGVQVEIVHEGLKLAAAVAKLAERPAGTVGHIRRLPARLPKVGELLLEETGKAPPRRSSFNIVARCGRRRRDESNAALAAAVRE
jgi:hypothetical protein